MSRSGLTAETRGRSFKLAFESPVESSFRFVPNFGCDLRHRITGRGKHLRSQLESPAREIRHWRFAKVMVETLGQY